MNAQANRSETMQQRLTASQISNILFQNDPMGTCCKENDCFDEYDNIAHAIFHNLESGQPTTDAVSEALIEWFEVESVESQSLARVVKALGLV
jgi:hypothetical protein